MIFTSTEFIIFFVIVVFAIIIIKQRKFQYLFLLFSSYFFFYFSSNYLIILLIASTLLDYNIAKSIWKSKNLQRKKWLLVVSLVGNLGLLGFFKYADFAILQFNIFGNYFDLTTNIPYLNLLLPIGISFYTFQTISYTVDVYRGQLSPSKSFWEFALFVSFFPQLIAGPIVRAKDFLPQLREKLETKISTERLRQVIIKNSNLKLGLTMMTFGFLKKMFFADNIAPMVNEIFSNPVGLDSFSIIMATIGFGIQIYGDFSGYSDIAIGAALILGFKLPKNFNKPYFATSPSDFWKRWHISLSSWLRDYLYIPLGGNRKSSVRTFFNLAIVMSLGGGLWHGASWNFVIWGLMHGVYLSVHKVISGKFPQLQTLSFFKTRLGKITSILVMQYFVFLAWIPFRVKDFDDAFYSMGKFVFIDFQTNEIIPFIMEYKLPVGLMILFITIHVISFKSPNMIEKISKFTLRYWFLVITIILFSIVFSFDGKSEDFIYFRF